MATSNVVSFASLVSLLASVKPGDALAALACAHASEAGKVSQDKLLDLVSDMASGACHAAQKHLSETWARDVVCRALVASTVESAAEDINTAGPGKPVAMVRKLKLNRGQLHDLVAEAYKAQTGIDVLTAKEVTSPYLDEVIGGVNERGESKTFWVSLRGPGGTKLDPKKNDDWSAHRKKCVADFEALNAPEEQSEEYVEEDSEPSASLE